MRKKENCETCNEPALFSLEYVTGKWQCMCQCHPMKEYPIHERNQQT